ncbi:MAG: glycosyltransferase family 1 protein [Patescibacteria group bacterium]|jgi:glycosyltransferase involved in cell wall biosynthesis
MRIGIDARFYGPIGKGLGRYTQEVVDNLMKMTSAFPAIDGEVSFNYVIFLSPENFDEFIVEDGQPIEKVLLPIRWYSLAEQLIMPFYIWRAKLDLMHFPHFNVPILTPVKFVVTIHDLILTHFPTIRATTRSPFLYYFKNLAYRLIIFTAVKRARRIITVSEFTKNDLAAKFKVQPEKITVTYEGVANLAKGRDSLFIAKLDKQETLEQYHTARNFLLYVGNAYPHKNLETLIKVFSKLHSERPELRLVLVGKEDYFYGLVEKYAGSLNLWQKGNLNSPVVFPGYVPDAQLEVLYSEARAYIFPSLYEGFGLPPLEAMARQCPVASSNRASLPEVLGEAALYFDPQNETEMLSKIKLILNDDDLRARLIAAGLKQIKKYNWWQCAYQTEQVYRRALKIKIR